MNKKAKGKKKSSATTIVLAVLSFVGYGVYLMFKPGDELTEGQPPAKSVKRPWPRVVEAGNLDYIKYTGQSLALAAKNYYVVFDASGSMSLSGCSGSSDKMQVAKESLVKFASSVPEDAHLGLTVFDGQGVREVVPLGSRNREEFTSAVTELSPGGSTPLKSAMTLGAEKLEEQARKQLAYGEYNLVVVTDGEADRGEDPRPVVDDLLLNSPIIIHTVGFCIGSDHSLNQPSKVLYKAANEPGELSKGLEDVLAESESFDVSAFTSP
jgi:hypothetical protein